MTSVTQMECAKHGTTRFYSRREGGYRCAKCSAEAVARRRRAIKRRLVEEAGGCCIVCGFDEHPAALQFHHLDPSLKSFNLGLNGLSRSLDRMRAEAQKCALLCANCHALVEVGLIELPEENGLSVNSRGVDNPG